MSATEKIKKTPTKSKSQQQEKSGSKAKKVDNKKIKTLKGGLSHKLTYCTCGCAG